MTLLDDIILDAKFQAIDHAVTRLDKYQRIVQADDYLEINAQVNRPKSKRLPLVKDFINVMMKHPSFNRSTSGYQHKVTGQYYKKKEIHYLTDKTPYTPVHRLTIKPDDNTVIIYHRNIFFIKITKLQHVTQSRYHSLIKTLIDSGLFIHKARTKVTDKTRYNAMRQLLRRYFKPYHYEWSFTFNSAISEALHPLLDRIATHRIDGTFYLHDSPRSQCKIKVYNITAIQERKQQPYEFLENDLMKFEITYKSEFFIRHHDINLSTFKRQLDLYPALLDDNLKQFNKYLLKRLTRNELNRILQAAEMTNVDELMAHLKQVQTLQTNVDAELLDIKKQLAALTEEVKTTRDIAEQSQKMSEENKQSIKDIKTFIGLKESQKDKRKQRKLKAVR